MQHLTSKVGLLTGHELQDVLDVLAIEELVDHLVCFIIVVYEGLLVAGVSTSICAKLLAMTHHTALEGIKSDCNSIEATLEIIFRNGGTF